MSQALFSGKLRAIASDVHPLQTVLDIVLTDFEPNRNRQQIPDSEAENLIRTALNQPIKINYENGKHKGHAEAIPIGTISEVWREGDQILARSILWKEEYPEIDKYLKTATAEHEYLGTSWEILYRSSESLNDVEILHDCIFQSTVIVDNPAYGFRTPIKSIAEEKESMEQNETESPEMEKLEKLQEIEGAFYQLLDMVYTAYEKVCAEMERKERVARESGALVMAQDAIAQLTSILASLDQTNSASAEVQTKLSEALAELETFRAEKAKAEQEAQNAQILSTRRIALSNVGVIYSDEEYTGQHAFILSMTDETFEGFVALAERLPKARAEVTRTEISLPEPTGDTDPRTLETIVKAIKELKN